MSIPMQNGGGIHNQTTPTLAAKDAEIARLRAEVEGLREVANSARQVAAWFTSGNKTPVSGIHQMTVSNHSIMADVYSLNAALAAMGEGK